MRVDFPKLKRSKYPTMNSFGYKPRKGKIFKCPGCGQNFYLQPCHVKRTVKYGMKYCSLKCSNSGEFRKFVKCRMSPGLIKMLKARVGEKNPFWKGDHVSIVGVHAYVKRHYNKDKKCALCGKYGNNVVLDLSCRDHKYSRNLDDWWILCRSCHMKYDYKMGFRKDTFADTRGRRRAA